jgi:hypothetical protein
MVPVTELTSLKERNKIRFVEEGYKKKVKYMQKFSQTSLLSHCAQCLFYSVPENGICLVILG